MTGYNALSMRLPAISKLNCFETRILVPGGHANSLAKVLDSSARVTMIQNCSVSERLAEPYSQGFCADFDGAERMPLT